MPSIMPKEKGTYEIWKRFCGKLISKLGCFWISRCDSLRSLLERIVLIRVLSPQGGSVCLPLAWLKDLARPDWFLARIPADCFNGPLKRPPESNKKCSQLCNRNEHELNRKLNICTRAVIKMPLFPRHNLGKGCLGIGWVATIGGFIQRRAVHRLFLMSSWRLLLELVFFSLGHHLQFGLFWYNSWKYI